MMDLINEQQIQEKLVEPTLSHMETVTFPKLAAELQAALRAVIDQANVTITIKIDLKK